MYTDDERDAARRVGPSATTETCLQRFDQRAVFGLTEHASEIQFKVVLVKYTPCFYGHLSVQEFLPWCSSSTSEIS